VQKAAAYVRQNVSNLATMNDRATYQIACAILFLDRLGDPQDEVLIQTLGLRLIAAQTAAGGWWYPCPQLTEADAKSLLAALELTRPQSSRELLLTETSDGLGAKGGDGATGAKDAPRKDDQAEKARAENFKKVVAGLPAHLKSVAAMKSADENAVLPDRDQSDNSNTQFALLGVWVAGRHKIPTERALALVSRRFRASQAPNGVWAYGYTKRNFGGTDTMTGAGLLGLAVGHGLDAGDKRDDGVRKKVDDESIKKGLAALGKLYIGDGKTPPVKGKAPNLYFMWTLERVGMLYQAKTIGDKDWYAWGAMEIVSAQAADGHWLGNPAWGGPPIETSFAMLFLQRANLVKDLSSKVEFVIDSSK
jgi:hypothetical protein